MPTLKECRLSFLQDILKGKKKGKLAKDVPARKVPTWPELAMKLIYPQVIERHPDLLEYLPEVTGNQTPRYPERVFFYRILNAQHEETYN
jgi:hypothetical protein